MKEIDVKVSNLGQSDDEIIAEVRKSTDEKLSPENKGKWSAEVQRDIYGKLISVNVNLPDSVTENEKANAVNAINSNRGVAETIAYPIVLIEQDMESLAVGTKILPDFYVLSGDGVVEGITEDEAKSGVKSFSGVFSVPENISHAYDLSSSTLRNILLECCVKCPSIEEGRFSIGSSQVPIYMSIEKFNSWTKVAPRLLSVNAHSLAVYNGKLYAGTGDYTGRLYEWNDVDAWVEVAGGLGGVSSIRSLAVYNGKLYGTGWLGKLLEWNGVDAWIEKASYLGTEYMIYSLAVYNGKLYGGTGSTGKLFEWNGVDAWVEKAGHLGSENRIHSLVVYNNKLYGGTGLNGKLYEWNGTNAWVEKAGQLGGEQIIYALAVYNGKLYGGTATGGKLYEWNDVDAWVEVAGHLGSENRIHSLAVYNNKLYGGTGSGGRLYEWNGVDAWVEKAGKLEDQNYIYSLVAHNNKLYGTGQTGRLCDYSSAFKFNIPDLNAPGITLKLDIPDKSKWYKTVIEVVGDNHARIEVQDELSNVILSSEGDFIPYTGVTNRIDISYHRYAEANPFLIYVDDLKISQTGR